MSIQVHSVSADHKMVSFDDGERVRTLAGLHRTPHGQLLTTDVTLNEWPELTGRRIITEVNVVTGRVCVRYEDPVVFLDGKEVRPEPVLVYEAVLGRPKASAVSTAT